jgi:hypothetical protein
MGNGMQNRTEGRIFPALTMCPHRNYIVVLNSVTPTPNIKRLFYIAHINYKCNHLMPILLIYYN